VQGSPSAPVVHTPGWLLVLVHFPLAQSAPAVHGVPVVPGVQIGCPSYVMHVPVTQGPDAHDGYVHRPGSSPFASEHAEPSWQSASEKQGES
jgi:hypothetical protein